MAASAQTNFTLESKVQTLSTQLKETQSLLESKTEECQKHENEIRNLKSKSHSRSGQEAPNEASNEVKSNPDDADSTIAKLKQQIVTLKSALNDKSQEAFALETDLSNLESQINTFSQRSISSPSRSSTNNDNEFQFDLQRKASQRLYTMRASSVENSDMMSNMDLLRENTPSQQMEESPSPPPKMYHAVLPNAKRGRAGSEDSLSDTGILKKEERAELEQRIRKKVEQEYQHRFDSMVDGKSTSKCKHMLLLVLNLAGLLFIALLVMIAVMGKDKVMLCEECIDCNQMLVDKYVDCQDPPISAVQIDCPI